MKISDALEAAKGVNESNFHEHSIETQKSYNFLIKNAPEFLRNQREKMLEVLSKLGEAQGHLYKEMKAYKKIEEAIALIKPCIETTESPSVAAAV